MRKPTVVLSFAALALCALIGGQANASLTGETIEVSRVEQSFTTGTIPYTVGTSSPASLSGGNNLYASATATDLILEFGPSSGGLGNDGSTFGYYILYDDLFAGTSQHITGFNLVSIPNLSDEDGQPVVFSASRIAFTDHTVTVGVGGVAFDWRDGTTSYLDIALQVSPGVPEPSTVVLFGLGALGLFAVARHRRAA
jgi:hypothetical protein